MEALIKIQSELKAPKNQFNKFGNYHYRSCEDILEALKPLMLKYGCTLTITDEVKEIAGFIYIEATASVQKGDEGRTVTAQAGIDPTAKGMSLSQTFGSASSYARKYALNGLFLIDDTKDADATNDHGKRGELPSKPTSYDRDAKNFEDSGLPWLNPGSDNWKKAVTALQGQFTLNDIKKKYRISKTNEEKLLNEAAK